MFRFSCKKSEFQLLRYRSTIVRGLLAAMMGITLWLAVSSECVAQSVFSDLDGRNKDGFNLRLGMAFPVIPLRHGAFSYRDISKNPFEGGPQVNCSDFDTHPSASANYVGWNLNLSFGYQWNVGYIFLLGLALEGSGEFAVVKANKNRNFGHPDGQLGFARAQIYATLTSSIFISDHWRFDFSFSPIGFYASSGPSYDLEYLAYHKATNPNSSTFPYTVKGSAGFTYLIFTPGDRGAAGFGISLAYSYYFNYRPDPPHTITPGMHMEFRW